MVASLSLGLALMPFVVAKVFDVQVGGAGGLLEFSPPALSANPGDQVVFHFNPKNHSVTQSSFAAPCTQKDGGFTSPFHPVAANSSVDSRPTFTVQVNDTQPVWIFCNQAANTPASHCGQGMIFAINCPNDDAPNSLGNFKKAALAIGSSLSAAAAQATAGSSGSSGGYGGYGGGYGGDSNSGGDSNNGGSPTDTAAYGGVTIPPAPTGQVVTVPITMGSSVWTTVYTSFPNSPAATPAAAQGAVHTVIVGGTGPKLLFSPDHITAAPRDQVVFQFQQKNHSVVQSSFADPCRRLNAGNASAPLGFSSGYQFVADDTTEFPTWTLTVNDTTPIWAFCSQQQPSSHCGAGMVFAINANDSSARNFGAFQALAKTLNGTSPNSTSGNTSGSNTDNKQGAALSLRASAGGSLIVALAAIMASLL